MADVLRNIKNHLTRKLVKRREASDYPRPRNQGPWTNPESRASNAPETEARLVGRPSRPALQRPGGLPGLRAPAIPSLLRALVRRSSQQPRRREAQGWAKPRLGRRSSEA